MQQIQSIGIDLAKNVFQVHGVDEIDEAVLVKQLCSFICGSSSTFQIPSPGVQLIAPSRPAIAGSAG